MPDSGASQREIDDAFERGRKMGRMEAVFTGIQGRAFVPGAEFRFRRSWFESYVQYERDLTNSLRSVQRKRWQRRRNARRGMTGFRPSDAELAALEAEVLAELGRAREAVDAELEQRRGVQPLVAAMRALPQVPESVVEYASAEEFLAEDSRRGAGGLSASQLGGADYGFRWGLEDAIQRWCVSRWRVSWLCEPGRFFSLSGDESEHSDEGEATTEVYAHEFVDEHGRERTPGRVWLLGKLRTNAEADRVLGELSGQVMDERNSLIVVAEAVAVAERERGRRARTQEDANAPPVAAE